MNDAVTPIFISAVKIVLPFHSLRICRASEAAAHSNAARGNNLTSLMAACWARVSVPVGFDPQLRNQSSVPHPEDGWIHLCVERSGTSCTDQGAGAAEASNVMGCVCPLDCGASAIRALPMRRQVLRFTGVVLLQIWMRELNFDPDLLPRRKQCIVIGTDLCCSPPSSCSSPPSQSPTWIAKQKIRQ